MLKLNPIAINCNDEGRAYRTHCHDSYTASRLEEVILAIWAERVCKEPKQAHQFTVFQPLIGNDREEHKKLWILGRGQFLGKRGLGEAAFFGGFILTESDLDALEWAPHRLLPIIPQPEKWVHQPLLVDPAQYTNPAPGQHSLEAVWICPQENLGTSEADWQDSLEAITESAIVESRPRSWMMGGMNVFPNVSRNRAQLWDHDVILYPKYREATLLAELQNSPKYDSLLSEIRSRNAKAAPPPNPAPF